MAKKQPALTKRDIYHEVTDRILELLDQGVAPWRRPIKSAGGGDGHPRSLATRKPYRCINVFLLAMTSWAHSYGSDYWATFNQVSKGSGSVRKGEKSTLVVFWKQAAMTDKEAGDEITIPVLRHDNAFNADQCDGVAAPDRAKDETASPSCRLRKPIASSLATAVDRSSCTRGQRRCICPPSTPCGSQSQTASRPESRTNATLFHELAHSTGHKSRLDRGLDTTLAPFGSPDYSKEELVAEMGSAFLCAAAGISPPTIEQSAAYIGG